MLPMFPTMATRAGTPEDKTTSSRAITVEEEEDTRVDTLSHSPRMERMATRRHRVLLRLLTSRRWWMETCMRPLLHHLLRTTRQASKMCRRKRCGRV